MYMMLSYLFDDSIRIVKKGKRHHSACRDGETEEVHWSMEVFL